MFDEARQSLLATITAAQAELDQIDARRTELEDQISMATKALTAIGFGLTNDDEAEPGARRGHAGKYTRLYEYLVANSGNGPLTMTFAEVEDVLGFELPASSRRHLPHWHSYDGSAVVRAVQDAGWRARHVNLSEESVEFWESA